MIFTLRELAQDFILMSFPEHGSVHPPPGCGWSTLEYPSEYFPKKRRLSIACPAFDLQAEQQETWIPQGAYQKIK
jgi:hypothetical protein